MVTVQLGGEYRTTGSAERAEALWVPLADVLRALRMDLSDLGEGRIGLCPDEDRCIPVPSEAVRQSAGGREVDMRALAEPLGFALAQDPARAALVRANKAVAAPAGIPAVSGAELALPDVRTGQEMRLAEEGRRSCLFAWASW